MSPRRAEPIINAALAALLLFGAAGPVPAQPAAPEASPRSADDAVADYAARLGLDALVETQLRLRLAEAPSEERVELAERLAALYAARLADSNDPDETAELEALGRRLLDEIPESDSAELRISLAKARYLRAERVAERHRLRAAEAEETDRARRTLHEIIREIGDVADRLDRRVEVLENRQRRGRVTDPGALRQQLDEARRLRSLASYYAGWSGVYLSAITGEPEHAERALDDLGAILGSAAGPPTLERVPRSLLRYEHVARAALGVAMAASLADDHPLALAWLDLIDHHTPAESPVAAQVESRRFAVLAAARRWSDLTVRLERAERADNSLAATDARLLAVLAFEADDDNEPAFAEGHRERVLALAIGALVQRGEVPHVLDLVRRYGSPPLGDTGFIVHLVRGLTEYDRARELHADDGSGLNDPATTEETRALYRAAARLLAQAANAPDASDFADEHGRAMLRRGQALFFAGSPLEAADAFELASARAADDETRRRALLLAIATLSEHAEARNAQPLNDRIDRLSALYVERHPDSHDAARILLRLIGRGVVTDQQAADVFAAVPADSPLAPAARAELERVLYRLTVNAPEDARAPLKRRLLALAETLLDQRRKAIAEAPPDADPAGLADQAARAADLARHIMHAALLRPLPDAARAQAALGVLDEILLRVGPALQLPESVRSELTFRRFQIARLRGDHAVSQAAYDQLMAEGGRLLDAARRLLADDAVRAFRDRRSPTAAAELLRQAEPLLPEIAPDLDADPWLLALARSTAEAAALLWDNDQNEAARDEARRIDRELLAVGLADRASLRRLARLNEAADDPRGAADAWLTLLAAESPNTDAWHEARYESLRLLAETDPARAAEALRQHVTLNPEYGPEPWAGKLRQLEARLPEPRPSTATPAQTGSPAPTPRPPAAPSSPSRFQTPSPASWARACPTPTPPACWACRQGRCPRP